VHSNLVEQIARQLAPKLRPKYLALTNERILVATPDPIEVAYKPRVPDVGVYPNQPGGGLETASVTSAPLVLDALVLESMPQSYIEIRSVHERRLVTAIEVLSPTNKRGDGLAEFRKKRQEMLASDAHLMEIDLLRIGERFPVAGILPSVPYFVFLSRANLRSRVQVWPIPLEQPLPTVPVPLLPGDSDVLLNLQEALQTIYDLFCYEDAANHTGAPVVPVSPEQMAWLEERLRRAGMR
jgi:hypothetical protein